MSSEALAWAFKQNVKPSGAKFTLVALCECANYKTGRIMPSIAHLCEITGQDRKTIIAHIAQLERQGFIADTGERDGRTKQIKVYSAAIGTVPKSEQLQDRNSSDIPPEEYQKRDTEPSSEPSSSTDATHPPMKRARKPARSKEEPPEIPEWMPAEPWRGFLDMRADAGKAPTPRAMRLLIADLDTWRKQGHDPGGILDTSTKRNWIGLFEPKEPPHGRQHQDIRPGNANSPDKRSSLRRAIDAGYEHLGTG